MHYESLKQYFTVRLEKVLRRSIEIACVIRIIFTREATDKKSFKLNDRKSTPNKAVHINCLSPDALNVKRVIKRIL